MAHAENAYGYTPDTSQTNLSASAAFIKQTENPVVHNYKYKPEDFKDMASLPKDLFAFYQAYETYGKNDNTHSRLNLKFSLSALIFSIKHREVEDRLSSNTVHEIHQYIRSLLIKFPEWVEWNSTKSGSYVLSL
jgi:hypothetical protein